MSFLDEMKPYQDKFGLYHSKLVGPDGMPPTGNGLLTTAQVYIINKLTTDDFQGLTMMEIFNTLSKCTNVQYGKGLYWRSPAQDDQEAHDDYVGLCALSAIVMSGGVARSIVDYGTTNAEHYLLVPLHYVYNNEAPGTGKHKDGSINWSAWLGRNPSDIAHFIMATGRKVSLFRQLAFSISLLIGAHASITSQDSFIMDWLKIQTFKATRRNFFICKLAIKYWWYLFNKRNLTMKAIYSSYVADGGQHPLCRYWENLQ